MSTFIPYHPPTFSEEDVLHRAEVHYEWMDQRRSVREFSDKPIPKEIIENLLLTASTAPSGAHKQPWTFCAISNPLLKKKIRDAAEEEEYKNYHGRMTQAWLKDLEAFGTNWEKPFLERAPWLIVVFRRIYELVDGTKHNNYYVNESVGLATGFLLQAIYNAGLVALTHTPSPMNFLAQLLQRPENERAFILIPVGYPEENTQVPDLKRKSLDDISVFFES